MKYQLIKPINPKYNTIQQILTNRGIPLHEIPHYLNTTDDDINSYLLLGKDVLERAVSALMKTIQYNQTCLVVVDSDCDGITSSALLINYLHDLFPTWVENKVSWFMHQGKQHGLADCYKIAIDLGYDLVIAPDSASNDFQYIDELRNNGIETIVLDHHEVEGDIDKVKNYIIINNQTSNYPNKSFSGVGIVWQFCRYLDDMTKFGAINKYYDLAALGNVGDVMSLQSIETKHIINKGFEPENICNPFIYYMWQKNKFKLTDHITPWGAVFYIVPMVNAIVRSGTQEEKNIVFESMLNFKAFVEVPSTKRGHKAGDTERIVDQAIRVCTNVKNRQTKVQTTNMALIEQKIEKYHLLNNKVLMILLDPAVDPDIDKNVLGLIANRLMSKYQRCCCLLTKCEDESGVYYQGSARGCDKIGVYNFKDICEQTGLTRFVAGHQSAFGLAINDEDMDNFLELTDYSLKDTADEACYYVDYIYTKDNVNSQNIIEIAEMGNLWGKDVDESLVAIENVKVTNNMVTLMSADKNPTLKITLPNNTSLIKFHSSQDEYEKFLTLSDSGYVIANFVGTCQKNEWNGYVSAQVLIADYEILDVVNYTF